MNGFEAVGEDLIYAGHVVRLYSSRFTAPDGTEFERDVVRHPGAVSIVPVHDDGTVVLVSQFRAPVDDFVIEIPAGKLDVAGESLETAAARELAEEVGLRAQELQRLLRFHNSIGFSDEESHIFLATGLSEVPMERDGIEEDHMEILRVPLADTPQMIEDGRITDAKTVLGLMIALDRLSTA